jgi:tripartite-type tricarboxylate transporter receptor subunit TctC
MMSMSPARRRLVAAAAATMCLAPLAGMAQTAYPDRPVKLIVPFAPGGFTDVSARILAHKLSESMGQQFIVENKPGAGSTIGTEYVAKSAPDGYTLLMISSTHVISPWLYKNLRYDPVKSFAPVSKIGDSAYVLLVNPKVPARTVQEYVALAKAKPDSIRFSSSGNGSSQHLMGGLFAALTGAPIKHVPYRGSSGAMTDLVSGVVESSFAAVPNALPQLSAGRVRALAVTTGKRAPQLPDVPTMQEAGVPGYDASVWLALLAPAGTPPDIVKRLNAEVTKTLGEPETKKALSDVGVEASASTPEQMTTLLGDELTRWGKIVKEAKLTMQ